MKKHQTAPNSFDESALNDLFLDELKDIYSAEKLLVKALPKMAKAATSEELVSILERHATETEDHVERLERVFNTVGLKATGRKCEAMEGLIEEGNRMIEETQNGSLTRDAAIILSAQKIEHYEIASYGTLRSLANHLENTEAADLLEETLQEEKNADVKLTEVAESFVNESAKAEKV